MTTFLPLKPKEDDNGWVCTVSSAVLFHAAAPSEGFLRDLERSVCRTKRDQTWVFFLCVQSMVLHLLVF